MDKATSLPFCLGTLALLLMGALQLAQAKPFMLQENELFSEKDEVTNQDMLLTLLLNKNLGLKRPSSLEVEMANKLEQLEQLERLKEHLLQGKSPEAPYGIQDLSPSHPNKRACFWKYCV
ncbi:urotensin-2B isoform X1 [Pleurodeles waltl]|uniref:urotensin-2B isoform X1 n=1 Tax=Pleurodeles waltl TaxID=8319 RepID=UPI003709A142